MSQRCWKPEVDRWASFFFIYLGGLYGTKKIIGLSLRIQTPLPFRHFIHSNQCIPRFRLNLQNGLLMK